MIVDLKPQISELLVSGFANKSARLRTPSKLKIRNLLDFIK